MGRTYIAIYFPLGLPFGEYQIVWTVIFSISFDSIYFLLPSFLYLYWLDPWMLFLPVFSFGENWTATCNRIKLDHYLITYMKIKYNWLKDLNVWPESIKLLEENIGDKFLDINHDDNFLELLSKSMATKVKINKWLLKGEGNHWKNKKGNLLNMRSHLQIMYLIRS